MTTISNPLIAEAIWGKIPEGALLILKDLTKRHSLRIVSGDLVYSAGKWFVTHSGLLAIARRKRCVGIQVRPAVRFCDPSKSRWAFKATVYKSPRCKGFVGYGDADPTNVSPLVRGAEMRVAETRAVNRALRKAYGIGICSIEEIGSVDRLSGSSSDCRKLPQVAGSNSNGNFGGCTVRDGLCQLIRRHRLDAALVKSYATDFCGVKALRDATREQVEKFVVHLAEQAEKDRSTLLCQLNGYSNSKGAA